MRRFVILFFILSAGGAGAAPVHTLERALHAVRAGHADLSTLVYKVKDSRREIARQTPMIYFSKDNYRSATLFRQLGREGGVKTMGAQDLSEFARYFVRHYQERPDEKRALEILNEVYADGNIEFAYFEPKWTDAVEKGRMAFPGQQQANVPPPDFQAEQFYLNAAPEGVGAREAWNLPGGTGQGIRILDVETGWYTDHFEFGSVFYDNGKNARVDHGTAVWGQIAARPDGKGVTGIAYDVSFGLAGNGFSGGFESYPETIASVIETAVLQLNAGDILLIEQHAPLIDDYGPIEYFEPVFKVLQAATAKGVHCVAAGGNGFSNLDDAKYNGAFDPGQRDSGCILVGAVDSPRGSRARERSSFSNYGTRIDAFGYGEEVVTTGYGDFFDGTYDGKRVSYTATFSGTSSAAPIVAGAVASLLGIAKAKGVSLTPNQLRAALRATGTPQEKEANDNVGQMPDIAQLVHYFGLDR